MHAADLAPRWTDRQRVKDPSSLELDLTFFRNT